MGKIRPLAAVFAFALLSAACSAPKTEAAKPQSNTALAGIWVGRAKTVDAGIATGYPISLGSTGFAPLSAGKPEDRKIEDYETQKAVIEKVIGGNGDVFKFEASKIIPPAFTEAGAKAAAAARPAAGAPRDPYAQCLPRNKIGFGAGIGGFGGALEIFVAADHVGVINEDGTYRSIHLNADASKYAPTYEGVSIGKWDGDKLVVETANFLGETANNWPMSDQAKATDTIWLSEDGKVLNIKTVYEDPINLKEPMARMTYLDRGPADYQLLPTNCVEQVKGAADYAKTFGAAPPK